MARHYIRGAKGRFAGSTGGGGGRGRGHGGGGSVSVRGSTKRAARHLKASRRQGTSLIASNRGVIGVVNRRGGYVTPKAGGPTLVASRSRSGKTRTMAVQQIGRTKRGGAILVRTNPNFGRRPPRAPFQRGLTHRGFISVRSHDGKSHRVARTYVQKIRIPGSLAPGSTRRARTAYVHSARVSHLRKLNR